MKKAQVVWTDHAIHDLDVIYNFLATNSVSAASKICEKILNRVSQIEAFPQSGSLQEEKKDLIIEYCYLIEGNYKIIYSFQSDFEVAHIRTIFDVRLNPEKLKID